MSGDIRPRTGDTRWAIAASTMLGAAARLVSLRALPVFGDEAIFLRFGVLLRKEPLAHLWISFQEAHAPMHVWLLALMLPISQDPVRAGRLLSVIAGIGCIPASAWAARALMVAFRQASFPLAAQLVPAAVAALMALCPFFVFAGRLARVDSLFLLESILAAGLAVTLVSAASADDTPRARRLLLAVAFGVLMALTMLTRQAVSYPLWLLPPLAWALRTEPHHEAAAGRLAAHLAVAAAVAALLWLPMLAAPGEPDFMTRLFNSSAYRPTMTVYDRVLLTFRNMHVAGTAFWTYLTPPVVLLAALGPLLLARLAPSAGRLVCFLLLWEAILLGPTAMYAASYFPRYALPAALPVCVAAGFGAAGLAERFSDRIHRPTRRALGVALAAAALGPSILQLTRGERDWRAWRLLPIDREQFFSGPAAGLASENAADFLRNASRGQPLTVLTPEISGNPTDAIWLLLGTEPGVTLSYAPDALSRPFLPPVGSDGTCRLAGDLRDRRMSVTVPAEKPFFAVVPDPLLTRSGWVAAIPFVAGRNPGAVEVARFRNLSAPGGRTNDVVVLRLRNPCNDSTPE